MAVERPEQWPDGFVVTEQPEPSTALVAVGDPYRDADRTLDPSVALEVAWTEDNWGERVLAVLGCAVIPVGAMTWALYLGLAATIVAGIVAIAACGWVTRAVWDSKRWLRVGSDGMQWRSRSWLWSPTIHRLAAGDIAQLHVRDITERNPNNMWPEEKYRLYVRDRDGKDHTLFTFPKPENAQWLEHRIEDHLGIPDRALPGEVPKPLEE